MAGKVSWYGPILDTLREWVGWYGPIPVLAESKARHIAEVLQTFWESADFWATIQLGSLVLVTYVVGFIVVSWVFFKVIRVAAYAVYVCFCSTPAVPEKLLRTNTPRVVHNSSPHVCSEDCREKHKHS